MYITALNATPHHTTDDDGLEVVGGKGRSLARMAEAGFNVPGGFVITAAAYRSFVATNRLQQKIVSLARPAVADGRVSFEQASQCHTGTVRRTRPIRRDHPGDKPGVRLAGRQTRRRALLRQCRRSTWSVLRRTAGNLSERQGYGRGRRGRCETAGLPYGRRKPSAIGIRTASTRARWPWRW